MQCSRAALLQAGRPIANRHPPPSPAAAGLGCSMPRGMAGEMDWAGAEEASRRQRGGMCHPSVLAKPWHVTLRRPASLTRNCRPLERRAVMACAPATSGSCVRAGAWAPPPARPPRSTRPSGPLPVYASAARGPQAPGAAAAAAPAAGAGTVPATGASPASGAPAPPTTYLPRGTIDWQALYAHLTFAAAPRVEAADALAHCKWEAAEGTLSQQQLWERVREEAREVAAEGEAPRGAGLGRCS